MPLGKRQRKLLLGVGIALGGVIVLWLSLPLWFPWLLRPLASKYGVQYRRYERLGYRQFALEGLTFTNQGSTFRAKRAEALIPSVWLWRCVGPKAVKVEPFLH